MTLSQSRSHFFRQANGRLQTGQIFVGNSDFFRIFIAEKQFVLWNGLCWKKQRAT